MSYPALYTHLKNKHAKGPDGNPMVAINIGRGRGRPKKSMHCGNNSIEGICYGASIGHRSYLEHNNQTYF